MSKQRRTEEIGIDIGNRSVKVIKTNTAGKILKMGAAALPGDMPDIYDPTYPARLSRAVRAAGRAAGANRLSRGVLVAGGPDVIIRRFLWPDMPPAALRSNARTEMAPYLPGDGDAYTVSCRALRKVPPAQLDVMVTAVPKNTVLVYLDACRKAGFFPKRVDVRENAREKLIRDPSLWEPGETPFDLRQSFAVLDVTGSPYNLTVFIDGVFYANRYFGGGDNGAVAAEIASILDYIQYRERGAKVAGILLYGNAEATGGLSEDLARDLGIPAAGISGCLKLKLPRKTGTAADYLDAYGASVRTRGDMDLNPPKERKTVFRRFILPAACTAAVIALLFSAGAVLPRRQIERLQTEIEALDRGLLKLGGGSEREVSLLSDIDAFRSRYPGASGVFQAVGRALPPSGSEILRLYVSAGTAEVRARTDDLDKVAAMLETLRRDETVADAGARIESVTYPGGSPTVVFHITLALRGGGTEALHEAT